MSEFEGTIEDALQEGFTMVTHEIDINTNDGETEISTNFYPLLPIRNLVVFPEIVMPITAGRESSKELLEEAQIAKKLVAVITQKNPNTDDPTENDLYTIGTVVRVLKVIKLPDGNTTAILKGVSAFKIKKIRTAKNGRKEAEISEIKNTAPKSTEFLDAMMANIKDVAEKIIRLDPAIPDGAAYALQNIDKKAELLNFICSNAPIPVEFRQILLMHKSLEKRANQLYGYLIDELKKLELRNEIHLKTNKELDKNQREYYLNQQMRTIQDELGGPENDAEEFQKKASKIKWKPEVEEHFQRELKRLQRHNPNSPDYNVQRNYLDFFTDLPWEKFSKDVFDLPKAQKILDNAHFGLEEIKKRILEHIAVLKLKNDMKSPILCLVGPPGVGKTSLGKSVADALGRKYVRISLGGLHDESEIRGHRKTYIGAMAGRIIQALKKSGASNPVIVLDEIDKIGQGVHGDPSSALLEVLDPEQNHAFFDNFLELGYDLSKVMFIATANSLSTIQTPLLDRMEVIEISGYTEEEKIEIAKRHLIKKQQQENGLTAKSFKLGDAELRHIIQAHTSESGVRSLNKKISAIARWSALQTAMGNSYDPKISVEKIDEILGVPRPRNISEEYAVPGVVTGLAWTSVGGDILFIESILSKGKGSLTLTGNLGNVMKESAQIALEYIKAKHEDLGISAEKISENNVHIHVPEGATPKDGPSAGIAMLTSIVSSFTGKKVKPHIAMTGEITLRGKVLPVGGIKEKLLAATRAGIQTVILCEANKKDVEEIKPEYLKNLQIIFVKNMGEVLENALEK